MNLRWLNKLHGDAPTSVFDPRIHYVERICGKTATAFVTRHHYSGTMPAKRVCVGLYRKPGEAWTSELVGVLVYSTPVQRKAAGRWAPGCVTAQVPELGRLILLDKVERNGETWAHAQADRIMLGVIPGAKALISYSDPVPRLRADGSILMPGHVGTIYQARNARYLGRAARRILYLADDGRALSPRALSKIRNDERGREYAAEQVRLATGLTRRPGESGASYVKRAQAALRKVSHPGNHVYGWALARGVTLAEALPYPKKEAA